MCVLFVVFVFFFFACFGWWFGAVFVIVQNEN